MRYIVNSVAARLIKVDLSYLGSVVVIDISLLVITSPME